ncbi:MAG: hypothetical protein IH921_14055 [Gemmatimonadetes bacterium]|nr:hypothetical protein [Gemmatimonadota bacterium]
MIDPQGTGLRIASTDPIRSQVQGSNLARQTPGELTTTDLLSLTDDELARIDPLVMNLIVAKELPDLKDHDIVVLHQGELCEEGTHQELLEHGGLYARLHELQFARTPV